MEYGMRTARDWSALLPFSCRLHLDGIFPTAHGSSARYRPLALRIGCIRAQVPIAIPARACTGWEPCCLTENDNCFRGTSIAPSNYRYFATGSFSAGADRLRHAALTATTTINSPSASTP